MILKEQELSVTNRNTNRLHFAECSLSSVYRTSYYSGVDDVALKRAEGNLTQLLITPLKILSVT